METTQPSPIRTSSLTQAWNRLRGYATPPGLDQLPCIPVVADRISTLKGPVEFREFILKAISEARERILISALYLENDEGGREILSALFQAKAARPELDVSIFVDWHRAQRGLIGKAKSAGNAAYYAEMARKLGTGVPVYGVPVQTREILGVMHLKGFVVDDTVLYSGASLNNVYLQRMERYRLDRYQVIEDRHLADSLAGLLCQFIRKDPAVHRLDAEMIPRTSSLGNAIVRFRRILMKTQYHLAEGVIRRNEVGITPLLGLGGGENPLNSVVLQLIRRSQEQLILFTPYFNFPAPIRKALDMKLREGCQVVLVLGDKTANDFFIPPEETFKNIGVLPYLYEVNLRRYCHQHQAFLDSGALKIHLWRHGNNTYHLKGLRSDRDYTLLTGNNLNPRAWRLDLENGLLIHDPSGLLQTQQEQELANILAHAQPLKRWNDLESLEDYPAPVQRLLKRLSRTSMDRLVKHVL